MTNTNQKHPSKTPRAKSAERRKCLAIIDHARLDPSHCLADGLFKPLLRGSNKTDLDVRYQYKGYTFHWQGPELLGINEQSVFLAIHRLAATAGPDIRVDCNSTDPNQQEARTRLKLAYDAARLDSLVIETSANELTRTTGRKVNGQSAKRIVESLMRMAEVSFCICNTESPSSPVFQSQLISVVESERLLHVGINPCLTKAVCEQPSTYVDMREQRVLKSDITKRLHVWLSSWASPTANGRDQRISMDKLISHIWGDSTTGDALYARRKKLHAAIAELNGLASWSCVLNANDIVHVRRTPVGIAGPIVRDGTSGNC